MINVHVLREELSQANFPCSESSTQCKSNTIDVLFDKDYVDIYNADL